MSLNYEYNYKFKELEKKYRIYLNKEKPLVIRLDGKNITKNHREINLLTSNFTQDLHQSVKNCIKTTYNSNATIYSILDETSIAFESGEDFFSCFDDTNQIYASNIFLQDFLSYFWKKPEYQNVKFGISMFSLLNQQAIETYIAERKRLGRIVAIDYYAKEKLERWMYHQQSSANIIKNIKQKGLLYDFERNKSFVQGIYSTQTKKALQ